MLGCSAPSHANYSTARHEPSGFSSRSFPQFTGRLAPTPLTKAIHRSIIIRKTLVQEIQDGCTIGWGIVPEQVLMLGPQEFKHGFRFFGRIEHLT
jgi:hypothetical protein